MDLQTRKISLIQEFLILANDRLVNTFEKILEKERKKKFQEEIKPMSVAQYEHRIKRAIEDFKSGKVNNGRSLKKKISSWK